MIEKQWFVSSGNKSLKPAAGACRRDDCHHFFEIVASPTADATQDLLRWRQAPSLSLRRALDRGRFCLPTSGARFGIRGLGHRLHSRTFSKTRSAPVALPV